MKENNTLEEQFLITRSVNVERRGMKQLESVNHGK